jgi:competence protein ComEA
MIRRFLKKYFSFNARERNGYLILISIIFLLIVTNLYFKTKHKPISISITPLATENKTESKENLNDSSFTQTKKSFKKDSASADNLFVFDPNTLTKEQGELLGLNKKLVQTILNFRSKGGKFKTKEDLKKIYGLKENQYKKLEPWILIENKIKKDSSFFPFRGNNPPAPVIVDINSADSAALVRLNGIGPTLASRILKFRNMLGGFYDKAQVREVFGMKDSLYGLFHSRIIADLANLKKLNVNTATIDDLKKHPYLKFLVAQSIVNYRSKHGLYSKAEDLLNVGSISEETLNKLKPYLEF